MTPGDYGADELFVHPAVLDFRAYFGEPMFSIDRVVVETVVTEHLYDRFFKVVLFDESRVVKERNREPRRHDDVSNYASAGGMNNFAEVGRLRAEASSVAFALVFQLGQLFEFEIGFGREQVGAFCQTPPRFQGFVRIGGPERVAVFARLEINEPAFERLEQAVGVFDVGVRRAPAFGEQVGVRKRRRKSRRDHALKRRQRDRRLAEDDDLVAVNDRLVGHPIDDPQHANGRRRVQRQVISRRVDLRRLQSGNVAGDLLRDLFLPGRVRLEIDRREEAFAEGSMGFPYDLRRRQIALPEFKGEFADFGLPGYRAENEAAVGFEIVAAEEFAAAFEREIIRVREFAVERVALRIDVIDPIPCALLRGAVNDEHQMRQRVESPLIVDARERVEFDARINTRAPAYRLFGLARRNLTRTDLRRRLQR